MWPFCVNFCTENFPLFITEFIQFPEWIGVRLQARLCPHWERLFSIRPTWGFVQTYSIIINEGNEKVKKASKVE